MCVCMYILTFQNLIVPPRMNMARYDVSCSFVNCELIGNTWRGICMFKPVQFRYT